MCIRDRHLYMYTLSRSEINLVIVVVVVNDVMDADTTVSMSISLITFY